MLEWSESGPGHRRSFYEFGTSSLDAGKRGLLRDDEPVPVPPKVLDTLLALIANRERVVTKEELLLLDTAAVRAVAGVGYLMA